MRGVLQRVSSASVSVDGSIVGEIGPGLLVLLGVTHEDSETDLDWMLNKVVNLRIFDDEAGKLNRSLMDEGGALLVVSQFTLYGECAKGRRPSYTRAAYPDRAQALYEAFATRAVELGIHTKRGVFGANMSVTLVNDGPVTLIIDSKGDEI